MLDLVWLIPALPVAAFATIALFTVRKPRISGLVVIFAILGSFLLALAVLSGVISGQSIEQKLAWFPAGTATLYLGWTVDPLTAVMLVVVTFVSLLCQVYSQEYMRGDAGYSRYYAFMALFTASMLGLVLANNFLVLYMTWELVGLCSYLLIGHWYPKPEAAKAGVKAFVVTRFGDLGFLIGIMILWTQTGTLDFDGVAKAIKDGIIGGNLLTITMLLVFAGAVGKSAQFPLHVWLPDAMEGPTPVSALIHAATMVAAGVYMVARLFHMFEAAGDALLVVAYIGAFTALLAATMGVVMFDFKRVVAYSTISQLGYMMAGLGVGAFGAGVFHLFNHAFFKALLFLASGSVIHTLHTQDLREVGGLGDKMRITAATFFIAALSLAGFPLLSGFWSKDEILASSLSSSQFLIYGMLLVTVFLTALYIFRVWFTLFVAPAPAAHSHHDEHHEVHESPPVMTTPLILLAIPSVLSGLLGSPLMDNWFGRFLEGPEYHAAEFNLTAALVSSAVALLGIGVAWAMFANEHAPQKAARFFGPAYSFVLDKYKLDWLYEEIIAQKLIVGTIGAASNWFDIYVIDGTVNGLGRLTRNFGDKLRLAQTGVLQNYGLVIFAGIVVIAVVSALVKI